MNKNLLLTELKTQIYDRVKHVNFEDRLKDLELEKHFIEKDILFKMREVELLQKYMFLNENYNPHFVQIIKEQVRNEFSDSESFNKNTSNKSINSIDEFKKCREIFLHNEYLLCNYLYDSEFKFIENLLNKSRKAYKNKNLRLLKFYEDVAKEKFSSRMNTGEVDEETLLKTIEKVKNETRDIDDNNEVFLDLFNDVKKLERLSGELKEVFLMSIPEDGKEYIM